VKLTERELGVVKEVLVGEVGRLRSALESIVVVCSEGDGKETSAYRRLLGIACDALREQMPLEEGLGKCDLCSSYILGAHSGGGKDEEAMVLSLCKACLYWKPRVEQTNVMLSRLIRSVVEKDCDFCPIRSTSYCDVCRKCDLVHPDACYDRVYAWVSMLAVPTKEKKT